MGRSRRAFTKQFKVDAVKRVTEQGYKLAEAARNLGIDSSVLRRWRDQLDKDSEVAFPSDRGSQYASQEFQDQLESYGMTCSMSRKGDCWDNAVAESFFHSLKTEWMTDTL